MNRLLSRLSAMLFLPVRRLVGPLHRGRTSFRRDTNAQLPPLGPPWTDPRWFRGGFPPRQHNDLMPLPDGQRYFNALLQDLRDARERVTIAGWAMTPLMSLSRSGAEQGGDVLAAVLREVSERAEVDVLLWSGAPVLFDPTVDMMRSVQATLARLAPRVRCALDFRAAFSHDHHQKAVTIDGRVAYVGGMDLTTFAGDRWDTSAHTLRFGPNWHDVQVRLRGEVVADVEANFCQRWNAVTGDHLSPLPVQLDPAWNTPAQIVRTVPAGFYPFAPHGEYGIFHALVTAIQGAERFIYLENQYLWAPEIVTALEEALQRPRSGPFRVVAVLPAQAYTGKYDNDEHIRRLFHLDRGRGSFHAYSLYTGGPAVGTTGYRYLPIYVHAKVSIVDDEWFSVGSANLNRRGIAADTEMNLQSIAPEIARPLRVSLWAEHLGMPEAEVAAADPIHLVDTAWPEAAAAMQRQIASGGPPPSGKVRRYIPGHNVGSRVLDIIQAGTLEH